MSIAGSIVSISELFKNLPVRKQYMSNSKRANEELKRIEKVVKSLALVHPRLRLTLVHNKFLCWQKTSVANLRQSIMQVVPISMAKQLHHILHKTEQVLSRQSTYQHTSKDFGFLKCCISHIHTHTHPKQIISDLCTNDGLVHNRMRSTVGEYDFR